MFLHEGWGQLLPLLVQTLSRVPWGHVPARSSLCCLVHGPASDHISWERAAGQGAAVSQVGGPGVPACLVGEVRTEPGALHFQWEDGAGPEQR